MNHTALINKPSANVRSRKRTGARIRGVSLAELLVVLLILTLLGGILVPLMSGSDTEARTKATVNSLNEVRNVIVNRYFPDMNNLMKFSGGQPIPGLPFPSATDITSGRSSHPQLHFLFESPSDPAADFDRFTNRGWNGPYLTHSGSRYEVSGSFDSSFGATGDVSLVDGWGNAIVIQSPDLTGDGLDANEIQHSRLLSAGPNGVIDTPDSVLMPTLAQRQDDLVLFVLVADTGT